jgi:hypothetical protein
MAQAPTYNLNYSQNSIFTDNRLNILADRLFYYLVQKFTFPFIREKFILTGQCAAHLQEERTAPAQNFVFITNNQQIYDYLLLDINNFMNAKTIIKFKNRILLDFTYCQLEIWNDNNKAFTTINFDTKEIIIEDFTTINPILL